MRTKTIKPVYRFGLLSGGDKFWNCDGDLGTCASVIDTTGNAWFGNRKVYLHENCVIVPCDKRKAGVSKRQWMRNAIAHTEQTTGKRLSRTDITDAYRHIVITSTKYPLDRQVIDMDEKDPMFVAFRYLSLVMYISARLPVGFPGGWVMCGDWPNRLYL